MKLITAQRVYELLDCYGANANRWPEDERAAALVMIQNKPDLNSKFQDAHVLDVAMGLEKEPNIREQTVDQVVVGRIVNHLPEQLPADVTFIHLSKKFNTIKNYWFHFGAAAAVVAVSISSFLFIQQRDVQQQTSISATATHLEKNQNAYLVITGAQSELDRWIWQEIYGEESNDPDEPETMMSLIELDT